MNTSLSALCLALLALLAAPAHAAAHVRASIDWQAITWTTTGDLTFEWQPLFHDARTNSSCCVELNNPFGDTLDTADQWAQTVNVPATQSTYLHNQSDEHYLSTTLSRSWRLHTSGSGSVTLSIPWEAEWFSDGGGSASMNLQLWGFPEGDLFSLLSQTAKGGGSNRGNYLLTVHGNGGLRNYTLQGIMSAYITPVPEPDVWAGLFAGVSGLAFVRRRKRSLPSEC